MKANHSIQILISVIVVLLMSIFPVHAEIEMAVIKGKVVNEKNQPV